MDVRQSVLCSQGVNKGTALVAFGLLVVDVMQPALLLNLPFEEWDIAFVSSSYI